MAETKNVPSVPAIGSKKVSLEGFDNKVKKELIILQNISGIMKKAEGLKGDEAFLYVEAQQYIQERTELLYKAELARVEAEKLVAKAKEAEDNAELEVEAPAADADKSTE